DEPATRRIGTPASASAATAPASYAPLAPPPVRISAVGTSRPFKVGTHVATALGGAATAEMIKVAKARTVGAGGARACGCVLTERAWRSARRHPRASPPPRRRRRPSAPAARRGPRRRG